jgi:four helix bundle protein
MPFLFEGLTVYQKAMGFTIDVYALNGAVREKTIKDQLTRAALSIPLNIAEGQGRLHNKEKRQFYYTARGSLLECIPLIAISNKLGYIDDAKYNRLYELANEISKMLSGLISSVQNREERT